jgi:hypothetical protein
VGFEAQQWQHHQTQIQSSVSALVLSLLTSKISEQEYLHLLNRCRKVVSKSNGGRTGETTYSSAAPPLSFAKSSSTSSIAVLRLLGEQDAVFDKGLMVMRQKCEQVKGKHVRRDGIILFRHI